jgi:hypothetical protein
LDRSFFVKQQDQPSTNTSDYSLIELKETARIGTEIDHRTIAHQKELETSQGSIQFIAQEVNTQP